MTLKCDICRLNSAHVGGGRTGRKRVNIAGRQDLDQQDLKELEYKGFPWIFQLLGRF